MEWKKFAGKFSAIAVRCMLLAGMLMAAACGKAQEGMADGKVLSGGDVLTETGLAGEEEGQNGGRSETGNVGGEGGQDWAVPETGNEEGEGGQDGRVPETGNAEGERRQDVRVPETGNTEGVSRQDGAVPETENVGEEDGQDEGLTGTENGKNENTGRDEEDTSGGDSGKKDGLWGLEHLEKYVALEEMDEYAMAGLRWVAMWCGAGHEGSFLLDGFNAKEEAVAEQIHGATGKIACWIVQRDFDGDGREEAFAYVCGLMGWDIEVYFAAADGSVQMLLESNTYAGQGCLELPGNTFYMCSIAGADMMSYYMYEVDGDVAKPAALQPYYGAELLENGRICVQVSGDDAFSAAENYDEFLPGGYVFATCKDYYYYYDGENFHEYSGVPVTEEEFCQYEGGAEILGAIREDGNFLRDIYYFGDGRMIVNYVGKDAVMDVSYGGLVRHNYYLQVPVLSEGEEGFVLGWDASLKIRAMQQMYGKNGEYDIFVGEGVYAPVYNQELAQYPDYRSPLKCD